jgi:hypothetical protein
MAVDLTPARLQKEALLLMDRFEKRGLDVEQSVMVMARVIAAASAEDEAIPLVAALIKRFRDLDHEKGNTARGADA